MTTLRKVTLILLSVLQIYLMDWAVGWLVVALTIIVAVNMGVVAGTAVVCGIWYLVYAFQIKLIETFVEGLSTKVEERSKFQSYVIALTRTMTAPIHGIRALRVRYIDTAHSQRSRSVTLVVGSWAAGGFLFMAYRRMRDGCLYPDYWRHARIGAAVFAVRFTATYAASTLIVTCAVR